MRTAAVLPVKSFARAKQRLGAAIAGGDRAGRWPRRWWPTCWPRCGARAGDRRGRRRDGRAARRAAPPRRGRDVVDDPEERGQSAAAAARHRRGAGARRRARAARARRLPGARPARGRDAARARRGAPSVVIVPDRHGSGTNALLLAPPRRDRRRRSAPGSFARHAALAARRRRRRSRVCELPSLGLDVDTPDDLAALRRRARRGAPTARAAHARACSTGWCRAADGVSGRTRCPGMPEVRRRRRPRRAARAPRTADLRADRRARASRTRSSPRPRAGRARSPTSTPGARARALAAEHGKDPRHVQVVLDESAEVLRAERGRADLPHPPRLRVRQRRRRRLQRGRAGTLVLLPEDPDASARALRARGSGCAVRDHRLVRPRRGAWASATWRSAAPASRRSRTGAGAPDARGRELPATVIAIADEAAAAADLARGKDTREPAVLVRGLERHVIGRGRPGRRRARPCALAEDLFR